MRAMIVLVLCFVGLAGCQKAQTKPTTYFCLTPAGWINFEDSQVKVSTDRFNPTVTLVTDAQVLTFSTCVTQQDR